MSYQYIEVEVKTAGETGEVAKLRMKRPPTNLLTIDMIEEMNDAVLHLQRNRSLEALVITGDNGCFSEGFAVDELVPDRTQRLMQVYMRLFETLRMLDAVQIAAVQGPAIGAGFEVALACNLFLASEDATFALPETSWGIIPPVATAILPRIAPRRKAMEWIVTNAVIPASELQHYGVVNRLLPSDKFDAAVDAFVANVANKSGRVLEIAKRAQFEAYNASFAESLSRSHTIFLRELMDLEDAREGLEARREGRTPHWKNR